MKTVIQNVLKLWSFEVAKRNGGHFEKTAPKDFTCHFVYSPYTILLGTGERGGWDQGTYEQLVPSTPTRKIK